MVVNWKKHCEKVYSTKLLATKEISDKKRINQQEIMFVKYLLTIGKDKLECFNEWLHLKNGVAHEFKKDTEQQVIQFKYVYNAALRVSNEILNKEITNVEIYQEEIDYLNNLDAPVWMRQFWGIMLVNYKFKKQIYNNVKFSTTLRAWAFRQITELDQLVYSNHAQQLRNKEIELGERLINVYLSNDKKPMLCYTMDCCRNSGTPVLKIDDIQDSKQILKLITKSFKICSICGKHFTASSKSKREMCDDCYRKYRRKYKTEFERKKRNVQNCQ